MLVSKQQLFSEHPLRTRMHTRIRQRRREVDGASRIAIHYLAAISVASWRGRPEFTGCSITRSLAYLNVTQHI